MTREQLDEMIDADENVTMADTSGITDMSYLFYEKGTFNQDISEWSDHVAESIPHNDFSAGCPLETDYHPYASWDD